MISLRLAGGLGNQLFQLSAVFSWADATNKRVLVDSTGLTGYKTVRNIAVGPLVAHQWRGRAIFNNINLAVIIPNLSRAGRWMPRFGVNDKNFRPFSPSAASCHYFDGYFQTQWDCDSIIRAVSFFNLSNPDLANENISLSGDTCVVHMRGGDFVAIDPFNICDIYYYRSAIKVMLNAGVRKFAIVCEDKKFAHSMMSKLTELTSFESLDIRFCESGKTMWQDFFIIANSKYKIASNSTFSWWASALGSDPCLIISPEIPKKYAARRKYSLPNERLIDVSAQFKK